MEHNLGLFLSKRALLNPEREAYIDATERVRLTFRELNARCNRLANALLSAGVQKGERIGFLLMNSAEFMEAYFALAKIGAVIVPLNWRLVADELEFILKDSGTQRLIFGEEFVAVVTDLHARGDKTDIEHWVQVMGDAKLAPFAESYQALRDAADADEPITRAAGDDMLYIMYTSGTTGLPKGVVHTHNSAIWGVITIAATSYYHEHERYLGALPMFHVGALTPLTVNIYRGATSVVMRSFEPKLAWELIQNERLTCGLAVPAMLNFMLQVPAFEKYDISSLRWIMSGAAPVPVSLMETYAKLGIEIHQVYGLTETCGPACLIDAENAMTKIGSTGKAFFHTDVRLVRADGSECAVGEAGEILVRGPHIMREYWNQPDATAATIVDGWLHSGDIAIADEDGFIYIQDRLKDMIISGGENVYPAEIESVLVTHPDITEAAVIGQASEKWGESPFAIVVSSDKSLTADAVMAFCAGKLAGFKQPRRVEFTDVIPRNPSGKILKRILREQYGE
ncbi:MAG: long-chain-fatty-acid--CoA ligase [Proteobacteria bacterium]|nr:MAG: long-chain-fatty-acid--CoA ligase [Pseudomonadota bacterium]